MNLTNIENINTSIDRCNSHTSAYDISLIVYRCFKNEYRYLGNFQWEYFDIVTNEWKKDIRTMKLKGAVKNIVSDLFTVRAMYWYTQCDDNINAEVHSKYMAEKLSRISYQLKLPKFISVVIKEARSFFDIHAND